MRYSKGHSNAPSWTYYGMYFESVLEKLLITPSCLHPHTFISPPIQMTVYKSLGHRLLWSQSGYHGNGMNTYIWSIYMCLSDLVATELALWSVYIMVPETTTNDCCPYKDMQETIHGFNTLRPRQNGRRFADDTFKHIFLNENVRISIKISLKFVPKGPINNNPALVQIMAWRRPGDKPLSESMLVNYSLRRLRWKWHYCCCRFLQIKDGDFNCIEIQNIIIVLSHTSIIFHSPQLKYQIFFLEFP